MTSESISSRPPETPEPNAEAQSGNANNDHRQALAALPFRQPPAPPASWLVHGEAPADTEPTVLIHQLALLQIDAHSRSNLDYELGGALLGTAYRYKSGVIVEVSAALPATSGDHGPVHFTFSADSWSKLHQDRAAHYPQLDIVGWFHTHPDLGVFYSSDDVVVHSAAFTQPWHVGLVVDPVRAEASFFGWVDGALQPLSGFYELPERQPESRVPWRIVQTAVWDQPYVPESAVAQPSAVYLARSGRPRFSGREVGLLASGLALLLGFFWVAGVVVPLQRRVNSLETTILNMAQVALADSNAQSCPDPRLRLLVPLSGQSYAAGTTIPLLGTAAYPDAPRYQVDVRAKGLDPWTTVGRVNRDTRLGTITEWNSAGYPPGNYELRLAAVDRNNIRIAGSSPCSIEVNLMPVSSGP